MAAKGHVVTPSRPAGRHSCGQEFGNSIQYNFSGGWLPGRLAGVDETVRRQLTSTKKLGITGKQAGSTNWGDHPDGPFRRRGFAAVDRQWAGYWYGLRCS